MNKRYAVYALIGRGKEVLWVGVRKLRPKPGAPLPMTLTQYLEGSIGQYFNIYRYSSEKMRDDIVRKSRKAGVEPKLVILAVVGDVFTASELMYLCSVEHKRVHRPIEPLVAMLESGRKALPKPRSKALSAPKEKT